jgi:molecular chaperone Hsp33
LLGEQETRELLTEQGKIEVTCEYCGRSRNFDSIDIARIFTEPHISPSDTRH